MNRKRCPKEEGSSSNGHAPLPAFQERRAAEFSRWELREALEYGVTDNYTVELYLNAVRRVFGIPRPER